jgi:hypothetical protein
MEDTELSAVLESFRTRVFPLGRVVHALSEHAGPPRFLGRITGFRYDHPDLLHFLILRAARIVSTLSAAIELAKSGHGQEIAVLLRTSIEFCSQIDYMLASRDEHGRVSEKADSYIQAFFSDSNRPRPQEVKAPRLKQEHVHDTIGERLDKLAQIKPGRRQASELLSNVYLVFSNYVHARYPECMDMFGGIPTRLHLFGMRRTPKDAENCEILDTLITSASLCIKGIIVELRLQAVVEGDPLVRDWLANLRS